MHHFKEWTPIYMAMAACCMQVSSIENSEMRNQSIKKGCQLIAISICHYLSLFWALDRFPPTSFQIKQLLCMLFHFLLHYYLSCYLAVMSASCLLQSLIIWSVSLLTKAQPAITWRLISTVEKSGCVSVIF